MAFMSVLPVASGTGEDVAADVPPRRRQATTPNDENSHHTDVKKAA
jgi:hypothetical protein